MTITRSLLGLIISVAMIQAEETKPSEEAILARMRMPPKVEKSTPFSQSLLTPAVYAEQVALQRKASHLDGFIASGEDYVCEICSVTDGSQAAKLGLKVGDMVLRIDGQLLDGP